MAFIAMDCAATSPRARADDESGRTLHALARVCLAAAALVTACGGSGSDPPTARSSPLAQQKDRGPLAMPATTSAIDAGAKGMFGPVRGWPLIPVHAVLLSDGRVMSYGTQADGTQTGFFIYDVWDPADDSHLTLDNGTGTDLFCSSQLMLPGGGSVVISGGDNWAGTTTTAAGNSDSNVFGVASRALVSASKMNRARWYSTTTMLLNGELYVQGGTGGTDRPEVRGENGTYRLLGGADTSGLAPYYPRNFIAPDGRLFGFDGAGRMYWVDASGAGSVTMAGQFPAATSGNDATAAMYQPGKILQAGGNSSGAIVIDITGAKPAVTTTASMLRQRRLATATVMADGRVLVTGGSRNWNEMTDVSYEAETWNPASGKWTAGAVMQRARLYHSVALLLPDASVLVAGGGAPGPQNNTNGEIFYPPYLFTATGEQAARPAIATAPPVVDPGRTVQVGVSSNRPISRVTFVATGSVTHGFNMGQRFVELPFQAQGSQLSVQIPARASDVPPGTWMMFVFDDAGVPSVAKFIRVNVASAPDSAVAPVIAQIADLADAAGTAIDRVLAGADPNADSLSWSASGLPPGLVIDRATGRITGTVNMPGTYHVSVAATDGVNSTSASFIWTVGGAAPRLVLGEPPAPAPAVVGGIAAFTASATGSDVHYRWEFGDGTAPSAWSASADGSHVYAAPGVYFVTVTARDGGGNEQRKTVMHRAHLPLQQQAPVQSTSLLLEPRGAFAARLWVVNPDNDSVTVFDTGSHARLVEIAVGASPRTLALAPDGKVWVVNKGAATLSVIDPATLAVSRTVQLPRASQPHAIAMARGIGSALVTLEATGQLLKINTSTYAIAAALALGSNPRHLSVAADGRTAWVSRFVTPPLPGESTVSVNPGAAGGEVVVVNGATMAKKRTVVLAHSNAPDSETQGRGIPNYLGAAAISPDGTQAFVPSKQDNVRRGVLRDGLALNFQHTVRAVSSRIVLASQTEDLGARIDHDNAGFASAAAFDRLGVFLFVALETSREVAVLDAHRRNQFMRIDVGRAPQAVAVAPDGLTLYVHNFMDRTVDVFDLRPLVQQSMSQASLVVTLNAVTTEKLAPNVLRGKQLFHDARDVRLARDRYMSCASCHNEGAGDGRVWDLRAQGEGLRNTVSLLGRAGGHGNLHWSNNFNEVQDFEDQIRNLAGGTGLMSDEAYGVGTRNQPLGDNKAGVSQDLDALAAYVKSLDTFAPAPARPSALALGSTASKGRTAFISMGCATCHGGASFTRSAMNNPADIGTLKPGSGMRLGGPLTGIDVPTLRDVWATAPYLHDGSAPTLEKAISAHKGLAATSTQLKQLAQYLREIGSEEPAAPAPAGSPLVQLPTSPAQPRHYADRLRLR
ncbi:galactose oxidase-like domain-containing protein [Caenimonas sp. SL110]|uniref:galactose oxidase-like domain-containing protein n=1 Tax=Caenimonas sp. SL110 TaxID=1450524 RepID=UPI0009E3CCA7|nr:galactose oxidase-like domain-containing protein [Caenimonas sp. SL110]